MASKSKSFTFIHAADLHLDSPFKGLWEPDPSIIDALRSATFDAYAALIDLCIERGAAFLLVAGDVYDAEDRSLRAQLRFRDGLLRLEEKGIPAFVVHGNHDHYGSQSSAIRWPDNVYIFGPDTVESVIARVDGEPVATISGVSHGKKNETQNLAKRFPVPEGDLFRIAMLHCNVGSATGHDPYAPCELSDLVDGGFDYWALGHVHEKALLCTTPHILYPGNVQGRHFRETGERGCYLVTVEDGEVTGVEFCPLDAVRWLEGSVSIEDLSTMDGLDRAILDAVQGLVSKSDGRPLLCRLAIGGRGNLYRDLRRPGNVRDLLERTRELFRGERSFVWLHELMVDCRPERELERRREAGDFLAEVLSISAEITRSPERTAELAAAALSDLTGNRQFERGVGGFSDEEIGAMIAQAELICLDKLEGQE
jgi:DNA repair exonuclease SbcCD nuclease subunit